MNLADATVAALLDLSQRAASLEKRAKAYGGHGLEELRSSFAAQITHRAEAAMVLLGAAYADADSRQRWTLESLIRELEASLDALDTAAGDELHRQFRRLHLQTQYDDAAAAVRDAQTPADEKAARAELAKTEAWIQEDLDQ